MHNASSHLWIVAPYTREQEDSWQARTQHADSRYALNCHRTIGGTYTGTRDLLSRIVPIIYEQYPDLIKLHAVEILSIAPDLEPIVPTPLGTLTSLAIPQERTRFYARTRTLRLAHGIIEMLMAYAQRAGISCFTLFFGNASEADALDQEFLAALLRRTRSLPFLIAVGTTSAQLPEKLLLALQRYTQQITVSPLSKEERLAFLQEHSVPTAWQEWLLSTTAGWQHEWEYIMQLPDVFTLPAPEDPTFEQGLSTILLHYPGTTRESLAQAYVASDCTSENLLERIAYQLMESSERQQMHDRRVSVLEALQQQWCAFGAMAYHYERGTNPGNLGVKVLDEAINYCFDMGYYDAAFDYGMRGRKIVDSETQLKEYWNFTGKMITALSVLERVEESEQYAKETRASTSRASIQIQLAYKTAMNYTRYHKEALRDHMLAKEWMQVALSLIRNLQGIAEEERAFMEAFHMNALALIEMHLGRSDEALRLIAAGRERMDENFDSAAHQLHRSVLLHNRGQVYGRLKLYTQALEAFTEVIASDPYYHEFYFDRGNIYRQLARYEEALQDFEKAILYSPPYPEVHYNRAAVLSLLGREDEALIDYTYAFELDQNFDLALVNSVGILYTQGRYEQARQDILEGLVLYPDNPQLLCTLGLVEMAEEHPDEAYQVLTAALRGDPTLREAWSNRAVLEFERGNIDAAVDDLSHALELGADATILYNRGFAYQAQERWQAAIADYTQALGMEEADEQELLYQRALCYLQEELLDQAQSDFEAHLKMGDSPHLDEISRLVPSLASQV